MESSQALRRRAKSDRARRREVRPQWRSALPVLAALTCLTVLVFARALGHGFLVWDDRLNITENPLLAPWVSGNWWRFWRGPYAQLYVPLTYSWFAGETWLSQWTTGVADARIFHAGNLLLHVVNVTLGCWLLRRLTGSWWAAGMGAAVWAVHPLVTESVAWVTETKGLLSAAWGLLSLHALVSAAKTTSNSLVWRWMGLGTLTLLAALLAKPSAAAIPLMGFALLYGPLTIAARRAALLLVPWVVVVAGFAWFTRQLQAEQLQFVPPAWWLRPWIALDAVGFYLSKLFWPVGLAADYARTPDVVLSKGAATWVWLSVGLAVLAWMGRKQMAVLVGLGLFVAALVPVLGLVPFGYQHISTVADRYAYLAMLGPAYVVADWIARGTNWRAWAWAPVIGMLAILSVRQAAIWHSDETLFAATLATTPQSSIAHNNLAFYWLEQRNWEAALPLAREAVRLRPEDAKARTTLGAILLEQGSLVEAVDELEQAIRLGGERAAKGNLLLARLKLGQRQLQSGNLADAERDFREALRLDEQATAAWAGLGGVASLRGNWQEARDDLNRAIALDGKVPEHHYNLGQVLLQAGQVDEAIEQFAQATRLAPQMIAAWQGWVEALSRAQQSNAAEEVFQKALAANPHDPSLSVDFARWLLQQGKASQAVAQLRASLLQQGDSILLLNELAWLLATSAQDDTRDPAEAVRLAERLVSIAPRAETLDTLAAAYASAGKFDQAKETAQRALEMLTDRAAPTAKEIEGRLELYRQGTPYREQSPARE
jgi:tetratricopeptide (TPR) repeat protein